jgi:predicted  nucleic acid-binding Zn-ribbon protein
MDESLKMNLRTLAQLQFADTQCEAIEKKLAGVDERVEALSGQLNAFEQQVEQERLQLDILKRQYQADENEVKTVENSIAKSDDKLRSVKTNKEYQSMLKEIDDLKLKKTSIEDRMIEALENIEIAERKIASLKADLEDMKREIKGEQEEIRQAAEEHRLELEELKEERNEIWARIDSKLQHMYARAKHHGNGIAVAAVQDAVCQECRMNIPPQAFIELQRLNELSMCPHCQRIIYPKAIIEEAGK